jgi:hypothetical protein
MDTTGDTFQNLGMMRPDLKVEKLSDEFGQYVLVLTCTACSHVREAYPKTLAKFCGWDARLDTLSKRLRCSKCGKRACIVTVMPETKPRGYQSH